MAKSKNTKKNIKKSVNKKIDAMETNVSKELLKVFRVLFAVVVVLGAFYLLTVAILGKGDTKDEVKETTIQYDEILAGSSFNMKEDKYVVCYFDYEDEELGELTSVLSNYSYTGKYRLYTVNMGNGFNKKYEAETSYKSPASASELAINGPTLIKFVDGKVEQYYEGVEAITGYLK